VVITITAYTEPVPPPSPQAAEALPVNENEREENEEHSDFAEILAGLLQKNEISSQLDIPPSGSFDESSIDALAEYSGAEQASFLSAGAEETGDIRGKALSGAEIADELSNTEFSGEYKEFLLSAEHLFAGIEPLTLQDVSGPPETQDMKPENLLLETELQQDFSSLMAELADADSVREIYASAKTAEDLSFTRTENKKDKNSVKDENIPSDAKEKKVEQPFLANKKEDAPSRLDEARARSRKDKVTFEVRDLRTGTGANESAGTRSYSAVETSASRTGGEANAREITLELRLPEQNSQGASQTAWEVKAGSALENMLARELHQNFNGDIVRHASMALRDGGEGTIKIALRPESLGNVKIRLEMTENKIMGHIVVESEEALNAFRKEISSLEQAFRDSGFSNADLNLSLTADGQGAQEREQEESSFNQAMASSRYERSFEHDALLVDVFSGQRSGSINMLA